MVYFFATDVGEAERCFSFSMHGAVVEALLWDGMIQNNVGYIIWSKDRKWGILILLIYATKSPKESRMQVYQLMDIRVKLE